jgi:hypothetical protein
MCCSLIYSHGPDLLLTPFGQSDIREERCEAPRVPKVHKRCCQLRDHGFEFKKSFMKVRGET